jgi:hypothetical protein
MNAMEDTVTSSMSSKDDRDRASGQPTMDPVAIRIKKAPAIFYDPEQLAMAFFHTTREPTSQQEIQTKYVLLVLVKGCATWKDFRTKVKRAKGEERSASMRASLKYLEDTAKALETTEKARRN